MKDSLRTRMKEILGKMTPEGLAGSTPRACANLKSIVPWREARTVLAYLPFGRELDCEPVIESALAEGKYVFVPAVECDRLEFREITSLEGPFLSGPFGIREPGTRQRRWTPISIPGPTLVLVPGLAFSEDGKRLGRGGGYYDRFIETVRMDAAAAGERPPLFIGYGYASQVSSDIPVETHDQVLDGLVTDLEAVVPGL